MNAFAAILQAILRFAVVGVLVLAAIVGIFVAWWIVVFAVLALSAYIAIRRFLGVKPPPGAAGAVIIEGEYAVERDGEPAGGRVSEVRPDAGAPPVDDNNRSR